MRPPQKRRTVRRGLQKLWLRFDRQSLTFKLLFTVTIGFILLVSAGSVMLDTVRREAIARVSVSNALYEAQVVKGAMIEMLLRPGFQDDDLDRLLREISRDHRLESVAIFDASGKVMYSGEPEIKGRQLDLTRTESSWIMQDRAVIFPDEEGGFRRLRIVLPVHIGNVWDGGIEIFISLDSVYHEFTMNRLGVLAVGIVMMLIGALVIRWLVHRIVRRPIKNLVRVIKRTGRGEFKARPHIHEDPDLRRLAIHFTGMVRMIEKTQNELERQYRHELTQANRLASLGHYISRISHEIKNPLAAISAALFAFEDEFRSRGGDEVFDEVRLKIKHIEQTVTNLLRYARQAPPHFENCRVERPMRQALQFAAHLIEKHRIRVRWELEENLPDVRGDEGQLQQVFLNLVLNAVYAMGDEGRLSFAARTRDREGDRSAEVVVSVSDTGIGMDPEQLEEIFKPFYSTRSGGTGLGLPVVKAIIEAHQGSIEVSSRKGEGTVISVSLPAVSRAECTEGAALAGLRT